MPLPGVKRYRPASDDEEEPGELIDDDSSSLSESETPKYVRRKRLDAVWIYGWLILITLRLETGLLKKEGRARGQYTRHPAATVKKNGTDQENDLGEQILRSDSLATVFPRAIIQFRQPPRPSVILTKHMNVHSFIHFSLIHAYVEQTFLFLLMLSAVAIPGTALSNQVLHLQSCGWG